MSWGRASTAVCGYFRNKALLSAMIDQIDQTFYEVPEPHPEARPGRCLLSWLTTRGLRDEQRRIYAALDPGEFPSASVAAPTIFPETENAYLFSVELLLDAIETRARAPTCHRCGPFGAVRRHGPPQHHLLAVAEANCVVIARTVSQ